MYQLFGTLALLDCKPDFNKIDEYNHFFQKKILYL
jgi:hypothetical protein